MGAYYSSFFSTATPEEMPAFLRCDGAFTLDPPSQALGLSRWCGWLRLEGHGSVVIRRTEAHAQEVVGEWSVVFDEHALGRTAVRIQLPQSARRGAAAAMLMREVFSRLSLAPFPPTCAPTCHTPCSRNMSPAFLVGRCARPSFDGRGGCEWRRGSARVHIRIRTRGGSTRR